MPVINIGTRQEGRIQANNIINVGHNRSEIVNAIKKALFDQKFKGGLKKCINFYGDGYSSEKIVKILEEIKINKKLLNKKITF